MKGDKVKITNKKHPFYDSIGFIKKENVTTFKGRRTKIELAQSGDMNGRIFFANQEDYKIITEVAK